MTSFRPLIIPVLSIALLGSATSGFSDGAAASSEPKWISSAQAGLTLTRGNSETFLAILGATTEKKWDQHELSFGIDGAYGTTKDQTTGVTTKNTAGLHGFGQYNHLFTERFYGYARVEALHDDIADIAYRVTLSPGVGYYLIKQTNTDLSVEFGPAVVIQKLGNDESSFLALRFAEKFHHKLNDRARVWEMAEWLPKVEDFSNYIINAEVGIEADLTTDKKLSLRTTLQDTYNSVPATGRKENDLKLITSVVYKF